MRNRLLVLAAALPLALAACVRTENRPPNILLIVADTLRADRLGSYGNREGLTPFLDEVASTAIVFSNTYAQSSWTSSSIASLFTSRYPSQHHIISFTSKLADDEITLATKLRALDYRTGGFSANLLLAPALGYGQGFDSWQVYAADPKPRGDQVNREALRWVDTVWSAATRQPVFLYLQYMEPHAPYAPPEPYRSQLQRLGDGSANPATASQKLIDLRFAELTTQEVDLLRSLYDAEVAALDAQLRALFGELGKRGFLDRCIVVITADHGEEFGEHGGMMHAFTLYNESIRVPLILRVPGYDKRVVTDNASLVDLAPTLLDLLGLRPEPRFEGRSLVPLLAGKPLADGRVLSQLEADVIPDVRRARGIKEVPGDSRRHSAAFIAGSAKLLLSPAGATELYDLAHDPAEATPNPPAAMSQSTNLLSGFHQTIAQLARRVSVPAQTAPLDDAAKERLRSLGYVGDSGERP